MASLTEASILTRKVIRYGLYLVVLFIIVRVALYFGKGIYGNLFPPAEPKATATFGKLPKLPFPEKAGLPNATYTLQTVDGLLPTFPELLEVYEMPQPQSNLQGLESAKQKAQGLGFLPEGRVHDTRVPNIYRFNKQGKPSHLTINIITGVFSISYDIAADPSVVANTPPTAAAAISNAHTSLSRAGLEPVDLIGVDTTEFLRIEDGNFIPVTSLSEAQITKVNIFRKNFGKEKEYRAVAQEMPQANIWIMFAGKNNEVLAAEYHYFPVDETKSATYKIKTADAAFTDLKEGRGYIAHSGQAGGTIVIRKVYLGYYDAGQYTSYYQPVVVFEGDNGFWGFVPAVIDESYGAEVGQ